MIDVALLGATGRMGVAILQAWRSAPDLRLVGALASSRSSWLRRDAGEVCGLGSFDVRVSDDPDVALESAHVAIDFTIAQASARNLDACLRRNCALVLGVTALEETFVVRLRAAAQRIAIVRSPNMSLGVNVCFALAARAARVLGTYEVEIVDRHHRHKRDAPSGTALRFGELISNVRTATQPDAKAGGVGYASVRADEVAGEHTVLFRNSSEQVEITHRANGRAAYAAGALAAARWACGQAPGLYGMHDVLGLEAPPQG